MQIKMSDAVRGAVQGKREAQQKAVRTSGCIWLHVEPRVWSMHPIHPLQDS